MPALPVDIDHWLSAHHGIIDHARLHEFGVLGHHLDRLVRAGHLVRVHRSVYRSAQWPVTTFGRGLAACLAVDGGVLSHRWAGTLWELRKCPPVGAADAVELLVRSGRQPRTPGITARRTDRLGDEDVVKRPDGIRLTNPARTACDLAVHLDEDDLASVLEQVMDRYRIQFVTVLRTATRLISPGRPGGARLGAVLYGRPVGGRPMGSHLERRVLQALRATGLAEPVRQHPITLDTGVEVHADLAYPSIGLVVEVDHRTWHSGAQMALDKRRDRLVALAGYQTIRITDDDVAHRLAETADQIARLHHRLSACGRGSPPLRA